MPRPSTLALLTLLIAPLMTSAATTTPVSDYQELQKQIPLFQNELQRDAADEVWAAGDDAEQASQDLFSVSGAVLPLAEEDTAVVTIRQGSETISLNDVPRQAWFAPYVRDVAERGIVSGYRDAAGKPLGQYGPGNPVTIAELAAMAVRTARIDDAGCTDSPANKAARGTWAARIIGCAEQGKWSVYANGSVNPNRSATRAEVVATILEAFKVGTTERVNSTNFRDVTGETAYANAIGRAVADKIVSGYADAQGKATGYFGPQNPINRAEVAKVISLAIQVYGVR